MSGAVALITDSSACLPAPLVRELGLSVLPISIQVGSRHFLDGETSQAAMFELLETGQPVKSSAPSALDYLDAIEAAGDRPVVVVTPAHEFTLMYRHACLAAEMAGRPVTVLDSRSAAAGHGLVVLQAAGAARGPGGLDDVVAAGEEAAGRADLVAGLASLTHLRQSGRVPAVALGMANRLGVRPVFRMRNGVAERLGLPRSERAALDLVAGEWRRRGGPASPWSAVFHAESPEGAGELSGRLGAEHVSFVTEFTAAMGIHTGPGVVGVAWLRPAPGEGELGL